MLNKDVYDVVVIGGGPAGYVAAIKAAQLGAKVAIVEKDKMGGTCLNVGCIPAKTYLKNAEIIDELKKGNRRGILLDTYSLRTDISKLIEYKNEVVMTLTNGVVGLLKSNKVDIYKGVGKLVSDTRISINEEEFLEAKKVILAGGSKVSKINVPGINSKLVISSDEIFDLNEIPNSLAIIGGGVIGVEMAVAFSSFGSKVTIIELADRIVPTLDEELSLALHDELTHRGIEIYTSTKLKKIEEKNNKLYLDFDNKGSIIVDKALLSVGRIPDLEAIGNLNFKLENGKIKVNQYMETSIPGIYAVGDINGIKMLAHAASKMGEIAAFNALGYKFKFNINNIPTCIYTNPEAASIGLNEEEARRKFDIKVGRFNFVGNGRALTSGITKGFVKVIADKRYGQILGVHIFGPSAAEIINEVAVLMEMEITVHEVGQVVHGHPTFSEALVEACADCLGKSIYVPKG
jgi:dihydrolipoamide dehydrogenase